MKWENREVRIGPDYGQNEGRIDNNNIKYYDMRGGADSRSVE